MGNRSIARYIKNQLGIEITEYEWDGEGVAFIAWRHMGYGVNFSSGYVGQVIRIGPWWLRITEIDISKKGAYVNGEDLHNCSKWWGVRVYEETVQDMEVIKTFESDGIACTFPSSVGPGWYYSVDGVRWMLSSGSSNVASPADFRHPINNEKREDMKGLFEVIIVHLESETVKGPVYVVARDSDRAKVKAFVELELCGIDADCYEFSVRLIMNMK